MNHKLQVIFYDGKISKPYQAIIQALDDTSISVCYGDAPFVQRRIYLYSEMLLIGAVGKLNPVIELKDDARLEFQGQLPEWFNLNQKQAHHLLWKLERTPSLILFGIIFVLSLIFMTVKWGIPSAAHYFAFHLPETTLKQLGDETERYIYQLTDESQLPKARQKEIVQEYQSLFSNGQPAKVVFRQGGGLGANALAIPNNTIILTDELVALAKDDREIIGVLAHEQGHLVLRHSLQQTLSGLGFSIIWMAITGDSSDLLTSLPATAIGAKYSRDFESEADLFAMQNMSKHKISTLHFANFLERLSDEAEEKTDENNKVVQLFQSHPATKERIEAVKKFEKIASKKE